MNPSNRYKGWENRRSGAEPLGKNEYKVSLVENLVKRAIVG